MLAIQKTHEEEEVDDDTLLQNEKFRFTYYMGVSLSLNKSYYLAILEKKFRKKVKIEETKTFFEDFSPRCGNWDDLLPKKKTIEAFILSDFFDSSR